MNVHLPLDSSRHASTAPVASHPAPIGARQFGDYVLERRLGSGAMGEVWLARHVVTRGRAALKRLHPNVATLERMQAFFTREQRAVVRLSHPHIVRLHYVDPECIVTSYVEGADLSRRLRTTIDPATAVRITRQIASALAHAHAHGVVHRDVKPSNILIDHNGNAFLTDFGLAVLLGEDEGGEGERAGTPSFMAPEQARGVAGPEVDQYALGRTLLEMLAGGTVAQNSSFAADQLATSLPAGLIEAVRRATAIDPKDRWPSMEAFAAALSDVNLEAYARPVRLAPEIRVSAGFDWCTKAVETFGVTDEIERADFRLDDLEKAGLLSADACESFRAATGYADISWSVWGNRLWIGSVTNTAAFTRASDLVVLLHGMFCKSGDWAAVAAAICRDNAQAVVVAPNLYGVGGSRFDIDRLQRHHVTGVGISKSIVAFLELLGVRDLPTVVVGHSASAAAILCVEDDTFGDRTSRIAITPYFLNPSAAYRFFVRTYGTTVGATARLPGVMALLARGFRNLPDFQSVSEDALDSVIGLFSQAEPKALGLLLTAFADATPAKIDASARCLVLVGDDDPVAPAARILPMLASVGIPAERIEHMIGGQHTPHMEHREFPGITARNVDEIAHHVETMLSSSHEGTPLSTLVASTVMQLGSTLPSPVNPSGVVPSGVQSAAR